MTAPAQHCDRKMVMISPRSTLLLGTLSGHSQASSLNEESSRGWVKSIASRGQRRTGNWELSLGLLLPLDAALFHSDWVKNSWQELKGQNKGRRRRRSRGLENDDNDGGAWLTLVQLNLLLSVVSAVAAADVDLFSAKKNWVETESQSWCRCSRCCCCCLAADSLSQLKCRPAKRRRFIAAEKEEIRR